MCLEPSRHDYVKAELHGTIFQYLRSSHATFVARAACRSYFNHLTLTVATTCGRVLKHVLKWNEIAGVLYDCRIDIVGMI